MPLLPYMDQQALWEQMSNPLASFDPFGPWPEVNTDGGYAPFGHQITSLLCPSDGTDPGVTGDSNYALNFGDNGRPAGRSGTTASTTRIFAEWWIGAYGRTPDEAEVHWGLRDVKDGTTNTILFGEIGRGGKGQFQGGIG